MAVTESFDEGNQTTCLLQEEKTDSSRESHDFDEKLPQTAGDNTHQADQPQLSPWQRFFDRKGLLFAILCGICSCGQFTFVNLADSNSNFSPVQSIFIRNFTYLVILPLVTWSKSKDYGTVDILLYILYGTFVNCGGILMFTAFKYADIGNVTAVAVNTPIPCAILGYLVLKEKISLLSMVFFAINFVGIVLLAKPTFLTGMISGGGDSDPSNGDAFFGMILACLALCSLSMALLPVRQLSYRGNSDSYLSVLVSGYVGMVIAGVFLSVTNGWSFKADLLHWIYMLIFSAFALLTTLTVSLSAKYEIVANVSVVISCTSSPLSFLAQVLVFGESLEVISLVGLILIIGSTVGYLLTRKSVNST